MTRIEGNLSASGRKFGIVAARWNEIFTERLLQGAIDAILRHGGTEDAITVVRVPGSF
ncbi:MAG TPA: 6,7-dimethyl-8-ribityllumazine synthase, partial [Oligoflexia bacterium]|nr:6,7-dimethyl-8-ribityllumazine synthase [Oligoflexia bacterium]